MTFTFNPRLPFASTLPSNVYVDPDVLDA